MATSARKTASNVLVWAILGLLFVALAGFGIGSFTGGASRVGAVGDVEITADDYARALQTEIRARIEETETPVTLRDLVIDGTDRTVLRGLVARAALADEAATMGLSAGDAEVARQIRDVEAFQGAGGDFSRETYEFQLRQSGLGVAQFEEDAREDIARSLLQFAVAGGVVPNPAIVDTIVAFQAETRDFSLLTVTEADLPEPPGDPTPEDLEAYHDDNGDRFARPEIKRIAYAWVTPSMVMDEVTVAEDTLRALYEERVDTFVRPERRLLERLVYLDAAEAQAARDAIDAGETDFDALVEDRGLTLDDVDIGEVAFDDLAVPAAEAIFADAESAVIGPVESSLGPALFRVNAVLEPTEVTFEDARDDLQGELAAEAARRLVDGLREDIEDLLAGGATLEELDGDTRMELGMIDFTSASEDGIAGYDAFRTAADRVREGDFPELLDLSDGGLFALRLDEVVPSAVPPLAEITDEVEAAWRADALRDAMAARADALAAEVEAGTALEDLGEVTAETQVRRQDFIPGAPPALLDQVFRLQGPGDVAVADDADRAVVARLDGIAPAARDAEDTVAILDSIRRTVAQSIAQDLFEAYGQALETEAGIRLDQRVIGAVHAQFQ